VEVEGVVALGGVARPHVVDLVCSNLGERGQGGNAQDCGGNEYDMVRKIGPERTHEGRRHGIAGAGEAIISADTPRHSMPAGDTEADSGDRWADEARARAVKNLGNEHPRETRPQRQNERGGGNEREPRRRQCSLPTHRVGERAAWDLRRHRRQPTDGERKPDVLFRPAEIGQVECEERAEAQLNIAEKKNFAQTGPPGLASDPSRSRSWRLWRCPERPRRERVCRPKTCSRIRERRPACSASWPAFGRRSLASDRALIVRVTRHSGSPLSPSSAAARDQDAPFLPASSALLRDSMSRTSSANLCNVARSQALYCRSFWSSVSCFLSVATTTRTRPQEDFATPLAWRFHQECHHRPPLGLNYSAH